MSHVPRVGPSIIPRSLRYTLFTFLLQVGLLPGQTLPDLSRPFDLGRPVTLPGAGLYLGDLSHGIELSPVALSSGTLLGELNRRVGWKGTGTTPWNGVLSSPGVSFEGISYPLDPAIPLSWLPLPAQTEFLDFPASAWWGPTASSGLVHWVAVSPKRGKDMRVLGWGGAEGRSGFSGLVQEGPFFLGGHGRIKGANGTSGLTYGRMTWITSESLRLGSGFHGAFGPNGDHWGSFFSEIELPIADFQTIQARPFIQAAKEGDQNALEIGCDTRYLFDMGGVVRSQIATGISSRRKEGLLGTTQWEQGYLQAGLQGDILGDITGDMAVRWDWSPLQAPLGLIMGFQCLQEEVVWQADLAKGVEVVGGAEALETSAGFRFQPNEHLQVIGKLLHEEGSGGNFEGFKGSFRLRSNSSFLAFPKDLGFLVEEKTLFDPQGAVQWDTAFLLEFGFFGPDRTWVLGRVLSGGPIFLEAGSEVVLFEGWKVQFRAMNLGATVFTWPEGDSPVGFHWLTALEGEL